MKKLTMILLMVATMFACKKDETTPSNNSLAGTWEGKWGDVGQTPQNFIKFEFKTNGTMTRLNEQGQIIATGSWVVNGVDFECTYTHNDGQVHKIGGMYTDFNGEITGTWGYSPSKANGGTVNLKKK